MSTETTETTGPDTTAPLPWTFDKAIPRTVVLAQNLGGGFTVWLEDQRLPHRVDQAYAAVDAAGIPIATLTLDLTSWEYTTVDGRARLMADGQEMPALTAEPAPTVKFYGGGGVAATVHILAERVMTILPSGQIVVDVHHAGLSGETIGNVLDLGLPVEMISVPDAPEVEAPEATDEADEVDEVDGPQ